MSKLPFGSRISAIRKALRLTQKELSTITQYEQGHISRIESNQTVPSFEFVENILKAHPEISLDFIIHGEGEIFNQSQITFSKTQKDPNELVPFLREELKKRDEQIANLQGTIDRLVSYLGNISEQKEYI